MTQIEKPAQSAATTPANKGVKQGLPGTGLPAAEEAAMKLWNVARLGTTTKLAFANAVGRTSASGGSWDTFIATLRGFGLIEIKGDQIGLTAIGQQVVNTSDPDKQREGRRSAVMALKAYRELVTAFDGTPLPTESALAGRLQFEYGKSSDFASKAAQAFLTSVAHAEMVDKAGTLRREGTGDAPEQAELSENVTENEAAVEIDRAEEAEAREQEESSKAGPLGGSSSSRGESSRSAVTLTLSLDLSRFEAADVIDILSALGLATRV